MVEAYRIRFRNGRACRKSTVNMGFGGKQRKEVYEYRETYTTDMGEFTPEEWRKRVMGEIVKEGKEQLLKRIAENCREKCLWLHSEEEIETYAMNCLAGRSYEHWEDFQDMAEIIWM